MDRYEPVRTFDEATAAEYDELAVRGDENATIAFLRDLAGNGAALELAIGTGRIVPRRRAASKRGLTRGRCALGKNVAESPG